MTKPPSKIKAMRIIWDIDIVQKNRCSVITAVFWIRMIRNRNTKTSNAITFGFIIFFLFLNELTSKFPGHDIMPQPALSLTETVNPIR